MASKLKRPNDKWVPKRWRPEYEVIVSLSSTGLSHQAVADRFFELSGTRYTIQHISNIVNTPEAKNFQAKTVAHIRGNFVESVSDHLERANHKAINIVEKLLDDGDKYEESPFNVIDRALAFMKITSKPTQVATPAAVVNNNNNNSVMVMTADAAKIIREGTSKADEVARLYGND